MAALIGTTAAGEAFNAGPAGAAVSPANSVLSDVTGAGTAVFDATANEGAFSCRIVTTATESIFLRADFTPVGLGWFVFDIRPTALPVGTGVIIASWLSGTTKIGDLRLGVDGTLVVRDVNTAVISTPVAQALTAGAWHRIALKIEPGSATGHRLRVYRSPNSLSGTTPDVDLTGSATGAAGITNVSTFRLGVITAAALDYRIDRLRGDDAAEPGGATGGGGGGGGGTANNLANEGFNAGPAAAAVTAANSTLDSVTGSGTVVYDATAQEGAFSALITCAAQDKYLRRDFTATALGWFVWFVRLNAVPTATTLIASWFNGTSKVGDLAVLTDGTVRLRDLNTQVAVSTGTPLAANSWARLAVKVQPGSATGHQLKVYLTPGSTTPSYASAAVAATAGGQSALTNFRIGVVAAGTITYRVDHLRGDSTAEPAGAGAGNVAPVADAGPDQRVLGAATVTLQGSGSDVDGTIASYAWAQLSGTAVTLSSATVAQPTFTAPLVSADTTLTFGLTVTDNGGASSAQDQVSVTVGASLLYAARSMAWAPKAQYAAKTGAWA